MEERKNKEHKHGGKNANEENEDDEVSMELLTRARMSFAATEEIIGEPEVLSPSAEQAEEDEMKRYMDEVLKETNLLRHTRLLEKAANNKEIKSSSKVLKSVNILESMQRSIKMVQEEIFPNKKITVAIDKISRSATDTNNNNNAGTDVLNVMADELIDELFLNLIANAVKYTDSNEVPIEITIDMEKDDSTDNERLKIIVADFGHGIADQLKDKIFERYNETTPISSAAEGSGLSLFIVKKLIDNYKGDICVRNRVQDNFSKGTVFTILLPLANS